jgi:hypothetical protein
MAESVLLKFWCANDSCQQHPFTAKFTRPIKVTALIRALKSLTCPRCGISHIETELFGAEEVRDG